MILLMLNLFHINDFSNGFYTFFLSAISLVALIAGIFIIITKNPVVSVLHLILLFSSVACYLIFVGMKYLGISYLLVYVGAVSILFLFILMLINIRVSELVADTSNSLPLAMLILMGFYTPYSNILPDKENIDVDFEYRNKVISALKGGFGQHEKVHYVSSSSWDNNMMDSLDITSIGNIMYTSHSIWLLITSIILLLAMVGSIVITIKQR